MKSAAWQRSRNEISWLVTAAVCLCLALLAEPAYAHAVGISRGVYVIEGRDVAVSLTFSRSELLAALPELALDDANATDELSPKARAALKSWSLAGLRLSSAGAACAGEFLNVGSSENDGIILRLHYRCAPLATLDVAAEFLASLSSKHVHLAHSLVGETAVDNLARRGQSSFRVTVTPASQRRSSAEAPGFKTFFRMGLEHILTGYDHLLFLFGLLLVLGPVSSLIWAITAFTLAHSLTLSFATLGILIPSPRLIEPLIAASITYVGIENWFKENAIGRWRVTFCFGLIHGFGFASALREISVPRAELPLALFSFNLGVEAGQLLVVALVLPLLSYAHRRGWLSRKRARLASLPVAALGFIWFVARLVSPG
jgi:hydrogenase/urease accessory protein HupE